MSGVRVEGVVVAGDGVAGLDLDAALVLAVYARTCENRSGPGGATNTNRSLTNPHSLTREEEGCHAA